MIKFDYEPHVSQVKLTRLEAVALTLEQLNCTLECDDDLSAADRSDIELIFEAVLNGFTQIDKDDKSTEKTVLIVRYKDIASYRINFTPDFDDGGVIMRVCDSPDSETNGTCLYVDTIPLEILVDDFE